MRLLLVRHGESEYNALMRNPRTWCSPSFWWHALCPGLQDVSLTAKGEQQAKISAEELDSELEQLGEGEVGRVRFLTSPLRRAVQTGREMTRGQQRMTAVPLLAERVWALADCGSSAETLRAEFPKGVLELRHVESVGDGWWLPPEGKRSGAGVAWRPSWRSFERPGDVRVRVEKAKRWLLEEQAQEQRDLTVLFGHSVFWHTFMGPEARKLRNCGLAYCDLNADLSVSGQRYLP